MSSVVCIGSLINFLAHLWWAPSLDAESSGKKLIRQLVESALDIGSVCILVCFEC